jgi:hypothetical protein
MRRHRRWRKRRGLDGTLRAAKDRRVRSFNWGGAVRRPWTAPVSGPASGGCRVGAGAILPLVQAVVLLLSASSLLRSNSKTSIVAIKISSGTRSPIR